MTDIITPDSFYEEEVSTSSKRTRKPRARREPVERVIDLARGVNLALAGATYKQIANELDVDEETARYHLLSAEGQRALRYAVNDLQDRTDRFLASAHLQAIRRLVREMEEADKPGDRIRAAAAITMLAARRIEITGANGNAIEVDTTMAQLLEERIVRMRERSRTIIDTSGGLVRDLLETTPVEVVVEPDTEPEPIPEVIPLALAAEASSRTPRRQGPAGISPGHGIRAIK